MLQAFGPGSWWIVWWALTLLSVVMIVPLLLVPLERQGGDGLGKAHVRFSRSRPVLIYLAAYFLFGAGYIAYMTFMIAYVRDGGGGAAAQSRVLEPDRRQRLRHALGVAAACWRSTAAGSPPPSSSASTRSARRLPIFGHSPLLLAISALVFGVAFFAVVGSTTAFVRFNYPPSKVARRRSRR